MNLPTKLTVGRILCIPVVIFLMAFGHLKIYALIAFFLLSVTDALDGYLARKYNQITRMGSFLDPFADKLLITALMLTLIALFSTNDTHPYPIWFSLIIICRDIIVVSGWTLQYYISGNFLVIPSKLGKTTTEFQMIIVGFWMLFYALVLDFEVSHNSIDVIGYSALIIASVIIAGLTIFTGFDYLYVLIKRGISPHPTKISPLEQKRLKREAKRVGKNKPAKRIKSPAMRKYLDRWDEKRQAPRPLTPVGEARETFPKRRICLICMGSMKERTVVTCNCGRTFHRTCALNLGECPRCGNIFDKTITADPGITL